MQLTQQIKINPTEEQENTLIDLSEKCRLIYNFALKERKEAFENNTGFIGYIKQQNDLPEIKEKYPEYKWVYSKVLQYVLRNLDADYKSFFALRKNGDKESQPPKWKGKKHFTTMVFNQSGFGIKNNQISFSHKHPSKIKLSFTIPEKFKWLNKKPIKQINIYKKDNYYVSITYEIPSKKYKDNEKYQAFDLGIIKHTAINNQGQFIEFINPRIDKYWDKKEKKVQAKRDSYSKGKKKKSRQWKLHHKVLKRIKRKKSNQIKDYLHKLSNKIVNNTKANTIIVGDLSVKEMCNNKKSKARRNKKIAEGKPVLRRKAEKGLHRSQHNTGYISRFVSFLTYKAELIGKRVIEKDERNTSKTCSLCGNVKDDLKLGDRDYICDCGNNIDRDRNSTINQMCLYLSQKCFVDKLPSFLGNLEKNQGIIVTKPMISNLKEAPILK